MSVHSDDIIRFEDLETLNVFGKDYGIYVAETKFYYDNEEYKELVLKSIQEMPQIYMERYNNDIIYKCTMEIANHYDPIVLVITIKIKLFNFDINTYNNEMFLPYSYYDGLGVTEEEYNSLWNIFNEKEYVVHGTDGHGNFEMQKAVRFADGSEGIVLYFIEAVYELINLRRIAFEE
jgi:hypothetical protein